MEETKKPSQFNAADWAAFDAQQQLVDQAEELHMGYDATCPYCGDRVLRQPRLPTPPNTTT